VLIEFERTLYDVEFKTSEEKRTYEVLRRGAELTYDGRAIDERHIGRILSALDFLHGSDALLSCRWRTHDESHLRLTLERASERVVFESSSNCPHRAPWNVIRGNTLYAQYDGRVNRPIQDLLASLDPQWDPDVWYSRSQIGSPSFGLGGPFVPRGLVAGAPVGDRLRKIVYDDPRVREVFPGANVVRTDFSCTPLVSPDCTELEVDVFLRDEGEVREWVIPARIVGGSLQELATTPQQVEEALRLESGALLQRLPTREPPRYRFLPSRGCKKGEYFSVVSRITNRSAENCARVIIDGRGAKSIQFLRYTFVYFPALAAGRLETDNSSVRDIYRALGNPEDVSTRAAQNSAAVVDLDGKILGIPEW